MTHFEMTRTAAPTWGITSFTRRTFGAMITWNESRITRKCLSKLTDRELDDIGLTRGDIARF